MNCDDARLLLHALLDEELDPAASLAVTRHLAGCAACAQRYAQHAKLRDGLRAPGLYEAAPAEWRARMLARLPRARGGIGAVPRRARLAFAALVAIAVGASVLAGWQTSRLHAVGTDTLAAEAVSASLRSLLPGHLIDVPTSDEHTVKPWFNGRLDFAPEVRDLSPQGFELVGGRLDVLAGRRVAAIVYRRRLHVINVFEWPDAQAAATGIATRNGYHVVRWNARGLRFVAVSDVDTAALAAFERAFRTNAADAHQPDTR